MSHASMKVPRHEKAKKLTPTELRLGSIVDAVTEACSSDEVASRSWVENLVLEAYELGKKDGGK